MGTTSAQLGSLVEQRAELQVTLSKVPKVYTILDPLMSDMVLIREKLGAFSQIWSFVSSSLSKSESSWANHSRDQIRADVVEIEKGMEMATMAKTKFVSRERCSPGTTISERRNSCSRSGSRPSHKYTWHLAMRSANNETQSTRCPVSLSTNKPVENRRTL